MFLGEKKDLARPGGGSPITVTVKPVLLAGTTRLRKELP